MVRLIQHCLIDKKAYPMAKPQVLMNMEVEDKLKLLVTNEGILMKRESITNEYLLRMKGLTQTY